MSDSLSPEVSGLFRCPVTQQKIREATHDELASFSQEFPEGAWITEDGARAFPVQDGFPILVPEESLVAGSEEPSESE